MHKQKIVSEYACDYSKQTGAKLDGNSTRNSHFQAQIGRVCVFFALYNMKLYHNASFDTQSPPILRNDIILGHMSNLICIFY